MPDNKSTKQLLLRISPSLYAKIARMAEDDFRSVNGEIEYLLTAAVRQRGLSDENPPGGGSAKTVNKNGRLPSAEAAVSFRNRI